MGNEEYQPFKSFDIDTKRRDYEWSMSNFHYHNSYEIYYLCEGTRKILVQDRIYEIAPGDVVMFRPNVFHRSMSTGTHTRYNVEFTEGFIANYFTEAARAPMLKCFDSEFIRLSEEERKEFNVLFEKMQREYNGGGRFYITLAGILSLLCDAAERHVCTQSSAGETESKATKKLRPIISYINANYVDVSSIEEIAGACYLNKSYMCRLFKREMGITVVEYLNNIKIQQACELLRNTDESLTDIAMSCGFSGASYFGQQFKKSMGRTPSEFRRAEK